MKKDIGHGIFIGCVASGGFLGKEIIRGITGGCWIVIIRTNTRLVALYQLSGQLVNTHPVLLTIHDLIHHL